MQINRLLITNFMSHRHTDLVLADRGLVLIEGENQDSGGSNGAGKSAIFEALQWCLFGKTSRGLKGTHLTKDGNGDCLVFTEIDLSGTSLKVYRYRDHSKYGNKVLFYVNDRDMTRGGDIDTTQLIAEYLQMDADTFESAVMFPQGSMGFASFTDSTQKYILECLLGLQRFSDALEFAKSKKKTIDEQITACKSSITVLSQHVGTLEFQVANFKTLEESFEVQKQQKLQEIDVKIIAHAEKEVIIPPSLSQDIAKLRETSSREKLFSLRQQTEKLEGSLYSLKSQKTGIEATIKTSKALLGDELDNTYLPTEQPASYYQTKLNGLTHTLLEATTQLATVNADLANARKSLDASVAYTTCSACAQPIPEAKRQELIAEFKSQFSTYSTQAAALKKRVNDLQADKQGFSDLLESAKVYENWLVLKKKNAETEQLEKELPGLEKRILDITALVNTNKGELSLLERDLQRVSDLESELRSYEANRKIWEETKTTLNNQRIQAAAEENGYTALLQNAEHDLLKVKRTLAVKEAAKSSLEEQLVPIQFWIQGFGNKGVKSLLLDTVTPFLTKRTNEYLAELTDHTASVSFNTQSTTTSGDLREKFSVDVQYAVGAKSYRGISGGERRRADIAVLFALGDLASQRVQSPVFLRMLDEPFEALDSSGAQNVVSLLKKHIVPRSKTVLVMSHGDDLKSLFDQKITVVKKNGTSYVLEN